MPQNFIEGRVEQGFLWRPDVRDGRPGDHLPGFLIGAVAQMDLSAFYGAYRADGHGRAAYEPSMLAQAQPVAATVGLVTAGYAHHRGSGDTRPTPGRPP